MQDLPAIRHEILYGTRLVRCFADRPPTIDAMLRATVARHPDAVAVVDGDHRIRYGELDDLVGRTAAGLLAMGYQPGERIALLLDNRAEFVIAFLAAARAGLISVPMNTRQRRPEITFVLRQNGSAAMIVDADCVDNLPDRNDVPTLRGVFVVGDAPAGTTPFDAIATAGTPPQSWPDVNQEDTLCLLYTSGTTGDPKGAMLTHVSTIHSLLHFKWACDMRTGDVTVLAVPASHVTGLVAVILAAINVGGTCVMMRGFKARAFLELAEREGMTYSLMVPAMYTLCLMEPDFRDFDLSRWRIAGFGGAPMPHDTIQRLSDDLPGLVLQNAYGSTETTSPATILPAGAIHDHPDKVGKVLPLADIIVVDEQGHEVAPDESGELLIGGPMVVPGYWDNAEGNAKGFIGGYWVSGDIGSRDHEGYISVFDRKKDMINRAGFKIYCIEVENALAHHPDVIEAAVVGTPDPVLGERVHAVIHCGKASVDRDDIRAFCADRLSDYKVPDFVTFLDTPLPRNANGKVIKTTLRNLPTDQPREQSVS